MAKQYIDWSDFSTEPEAVDLLSNSIRQGVDYDAYGDKRVFKAIVLSPCIQITDTEAQAYGNAFKQEISATGRKFKFKARIVEKNSPHSFIPNPCDLSTNDATKDSDINPESLVAMHTEVIMVHEGHINPPGMGDIVEIELQKNDFSYNLDVARFVKTAARNAGALSLNNEHGCKTVARSFDGMAPFGTGGSGATGPKDDPTFVKCRAQYYPNLPKSVTRFLTYTQAEVITAIKASGQSASVQKIMFAIISKEQPRFRFPANNVAGIQLDNKSGFAGATESDFDYQTCFRDSGGDQRIFAGFNNLTRGVRVFGKLIQGKMSVFKNLPGSSELSDADLMTWNYYRSWNTAFSDSELTELKSTGQVVKSDGRVYPRSWSSTTKTFTKAFTKWKSA